MSATVRNDGFNRAVDQAVASLVESEHLSGCSVVHLPKLFPDGAHVTVHIWQGKEGVTVSDGALGYVKAATDFGGGKLFLKAAERQKELYGLSLRGHAIEVLGLRYDQISYGIVAVSEAVTAAFADACARAESAAKETGAKRLVARLSRVFPERLSPKAEVMGESTHTWKVDALVERDGVQTIFEAVSKKPASYGTTMTKFHDIARLPNAPRRVSVVESKQGLGDLIGVLAQASTVVEIGEKDETFRRIVERP